MRKLFRKRGCVFLISCLFIVCNAENFCRGQDRQIESRPLNTFNLRNLQFNFSVLSARPAAMGGAAIALPDDPATVSINPAGLGLYARPAISLSLRLNSYAFEEPASACNNDKNLIEDSETFFDQILLSAVVVLKNFRFATFREGVFDAKLSFEAINRFTIPAPGLSAEEILQQNFATRKTSLHIQVVDNGGSLGWRFSSKLNVGATIRLTRLEYNLIEGQFYENEFDSITTLQCGQSDISADNLYLIQTVDERKWGIGYSVGLLSRLTNRLALGLVYHKRPAFQLESRIILPQFRIQYNNSSTIIPAQEDTTVWIPFKLPDSYGFGLAYKYRGWMNIGFDILRIRYSQMVNANARLSSPGDPRNLIQDDNDEPEGEPDLILQDQWEVHAGLEYIFNFSSSKWRFPVRVGYYYDPPHRVFARDNNPILQEAFPKKDGQHHVTGGLGFFFAEKLRLDGAIDISSNSWVIVGSSVYTF
jgi:long-subunit fatty acid transport protein